MSYIAFMKQQLKQQAIILYLEGKTIEQICSMIDLCEKTVSKTLKGNGIVVKSGPEYNRTKRFNEDYFEAIDDSKKAYFLGLLYADGNIYLKRKRVQICLCNEDSYILAEFGKALGYDGIFYSDRGRYTSLSLDSEKLSSDLIRLGCTPRKSLTLKFPSEDQVPEYLLSHFIRGYFDGDGSIYFRERTSNFKQISLTSTEEFLKGIVASTLYLNLKWSRFYRRYVRSDSAGYITVGNKGDITKFYNYIYKDCDNLFLTRKKLKFEI